MTGTLAPWTSSRSSSRLRAPPSLAAAGAWLTKGKDGKLKVMLRPHACAVTEMVIHKGLRMCRPPRTWYTQPDLMTLPALLSC